MNNIEEINEFLINNNIKLKFSKELIINICLKSISILENGSSLIFLNSNFIIVGDLHGNLNDLLNIFNKFGLPPNTNYLFLGDYIDRGLKSIEVIIILLTLLIQYPKNIILLRGNHEFSHINKIYGFYDDILKIYNDENIWNKFQEVFSWLPFVAILSLKIFCVHGGISPKLNNFNDILSIKLPINTYSEDSLICDLVWSDPSDELNDFKKNNRGSGYYFGKNSLLNFLKFNKLKYFIRSHQCVANGFNLFSNNLGITLFSSSNYNRILANKCGIVNFEINNLKIIVFNSNGTVYLQKNLLINKNKIEKNKKIIDI